jgi:hypothetical protein
MNTRFGTANYEEAFACDGSLRDLYVVSSSRSDWTAFLKFVRSSRHAYRFELNDVPAQLPSDAESLFPRSTDDFPLLQIDINGIRLNCRFYLENEIELDLDPREVADDAGVTSVLDFMSGLGRSVRKEVLMTAENVPTAVIFRYDPLTDKVSYVPPPFGH